MRMPIVALLVLFVSGCATVSPLPIPEIENSDTEFQVIQTGETKASFALSKILQDIDRGAKVIALPNLGSYKGSGAYCNYQGAAELTYVGGKQLLGNWSTDLGDEFYDILSNLGYKVAGDRTDLFNQEGSVSSAEYLVGARVVDLRGNYCHKHHWWDGRPLHAYSGETYLKIEWSVLNTLTKDVIIKKSTEGYGAQEEPIIDGIYSSFRLAFTDATERFAKDRRVRAIAVGSQIASDESVSDHIPEVVITDGKSPGMFNSRDIEPYAVTIRVGMGHGSGFIVGNDGYVITNAHVVGEAEKVQVVTSMGLEIEGTVISKSKSRDVALISTPLKIRNPVPVDTAIPVVSSDVYAVGSPLKEELSLTVTKGIVSAIRSDSASGNVFIQGDVAISPGNSGGPLFSKNGDLIGLSVAKYVGENASGLNLFIPIDEAFKHLNIKLKD